eukprot:666980_1
MADIEKVCTAIGRYYASCGKEYDALFSEFCEENGMEELEDEIAEGWEESLLSDFDDCFPFDAEPNDDETKKQFVFRLIEKCYNNPNITFFKLPHDQDKATELKLPHDQDKATELKLPHDQD